MKKPLIVMTLVATTLLLVTPLVAQSPEEEVAARIRAVYAEQREGGNPDVGSKEGTLNFWSSGGLLQETPAGPPVPTETNLFPKHIEVVVHGDAAVAFYYAEGTMTPPGGEVVSNYLTRVMEFWIKEDGDWVVRGAHYSPLKGGQGTTQVTP